MKWKRHLFLIIGVLFSFVNAQSPTFSVDMEASSQAIQPTLANVGSGAEFTIAIRGSNLTHVRTYDCSVQFDPAKFDYVSGSALEGYAGAGEQNLLKANGASTTFPQVEIQGASNNIVVFTNTILGQPDLEASGGGLLCIMSFKSKLIDGESGDFQIIQGRTIDKSLNETVITSFANGICSASDIYTVTISANANGSVNPSGEVFVIEGDNLNVEATANANYHFLQWEVTGSIVATDPDKTGQFTVNGNGTIAATFEADPVPGMSVDMNSALAGIQPEIVGKGTGDTVVIEIRGHDLSDVRSYGCNVKFDHTKFEYVAGSAQEGNPATPEQNIFKANGATTTNFLISTPGEDNIEIANTIMSQPALMVDGNGLLAVVKFKSLLNEGGSGTFEIEEGKTVDTDLNETSITLLNDGTYHCPYTVTFIAGSNGSITGTLIQKVRLGGNCTAVTAVPGTGYHFTGWTGGYTSTTNPLTVTNVTSNITITADFAINTYTVTFVAGSNGTITGTLSQNVAHGGNCTEVTAVPSTGYKFTGWTGGNTGTTNPLTVTNVTSNMTVTANFDLDVPITNNVTVNNNKIDFIVGPNPAKSSDIIKFQISGPVIGDAIVIIFDAVGNVVFKNEYSLNNPNGRPLVFGSWSLVNKRIGSGAYCAILKITDRNGDITNAKKLIGIKE